MQCLLFIIEENFAFYLHFLAVNLILSCMYFRISPSLEKFSSITIWHLWHILKYS